MRMPRTPDLESCLLSVALCIPQAITVSLVLQLHALAVENATLRQSLSQHEHKSQLELQDLRKLCLANQDKFNYLDHGLLGDLQQEHQRQQDRMAALESGLNDSQGKLQKVHDNLHQARLCVIVSASFMFLQPTDGLSGPTAAVL